MKDVSKKDSNIIIDLFILFQDFKGHKIVQKKRNSQKIEQCFLQFEKKSLTQKISAPDD